MATMDEKTIGFPLPVSDLDASRLLRVSSGSRVEPNFNKNPLKRFSPPANSAEYGVCYTADELVTAVAETLIHSVTADERGRFCVPHQTASELYVHELDSDSPLQIVPFNDELLKRLRAEPSEIQSPTDLSHAQSWSLAIHRHSEEIDGLEYVSRQMNGHKAVAIFCRAKTRRGLRVIRKIRLVDHDLFSPAINRLCIDLE